MNHKNVNHKNVNHKNVNHKNVNHKNVNVVIFGATSAIAEAAARRYAERGAALYLLARDELKLASIAADLRVRGASATTTRQFDADNLDEHAKLLDEAFESLGSVDVALVAYGTLPDQQRAEQEVDAALTDLHTNGISTVSVIMRLANHLERQGSGTLAVITSVAGDRGRRSNYVYGAAKRMVSTVLDGLRIRLQHSDVHVVDVRPGFVDTPMTADIKKGALWADPQAVGDRIVEAIDEGKRVVYAPWFWSPIMAGIRNTPHAIFRRLPL